VRVHAVHRFHFRRDKESITLDISDPEFNDPIEPMSSEMIDALLALYPGFRLYKYTCEIVDDYEPPF
jgi:hypothetical protein